MTPSASLSKREPDTQEKQLPLKICAVNGCMKPAKVMVFGSYYCEEHEQGIKEVMGVANEIAKRVINEATKERIL